MISVLLWNDFILHHLYLMAFDETPTTPLTVSKPVKTEIVIILIYFKLYYAKGAKQYIILLP